MSGDKQEQQLELIQRHWDLLSQETKNLLLQSGLFKPPKPR